MTAPAPANFDSPAVHMEWANLLFLHWRIDPALMRSLVPAELELDLFDGSAWVALVPFRMQNCRFRGVPALPGLANFYECNVRTYVRYRGQSGVWFFSLDAQTLLPVLGGRWLWSLNYVYSRFNVSHREQDRVTDYRLQRRSGPWNAGATSVAWREGDALPQAVAGSLEHFLTERYWLMTRRFGMICGGQIQHQPWELRQAEVLHLEDSLVSAAGFKKLDGPPLALASRCLAVKGAALERIY